MPSPFKFLDAYTKEDKDIFFGRDDEIEELYQKVFGNKLLLVCGVSGTGKTSLIECGLANKFQDSDWLPINIRRGNDITTSLKAGISKSAITPIKGSQSIIKQLQSLYLDHFKPIYLIFDQFEEVFIFGNREERQEFIKEIKNIIDSDVQCKLLFVMREESLAGAIEFEREIPTFLTNRIRIERMTWHNAMQVIEEPCKFHGIEVEEGLAENILGKLSPESTEVELTYLQVLLDKLYHLATDKDKEKPVFSSKLLSEIGDVSDLLGSFLDEQINQLNDPETGLVILKSFVSVRGTKRQVTYLDITDFAATLGKAISEEDLNSLIQKFINLRILRDKDESGRYELRHDSLATKIYEKITLYEKELLEIRQFLDNAYNNYEKRNKLLGIDDLEYIAPYEKKLFLNPGINRFIETSKREVHKAKRRRRQIITVLAIALIAILSGFSIWALNERGKAVKLRILALEQRNAAIEAKEETEKAREEAVNERRKAEENEQIAVEQRQEAINANDEAENARKQALAHQLKAEKNEILAMALKLEAENQKEEAETAKEQAEIERQIATRNYRKAKAGNLLIQVPSISEEDPTLAIRLAEYSLELDDNDHARGTIQQIYSENNFYKTVARHRYPVNSADISPDGKTILTGSNDNTACLWDLNGQRLLEIKSHSAEVTSVKFSADGKYFLTGSRDKTACVWDLSGQMIRKFTGHEGSVTTVGMSPLGDYVTGSEDLQTRIWYANGTFSSLISSDPVTNVGFSPDGDYLFIAFSSNHFKLFDFKRNGEQDFKAGETICYLEDGSYVENDIQAIAFSPDGQRIITGSTDRNLRIWNISGRREVTIGPFQQKFTSLTFTPDGEKIVIGTEDGEILMMTLDAKIIQEYKGHKAAISSLAFSSDGHYLLSGSLDNTARIWDVSGESRQYWKAHEQAVNRIAYSPDGNNFLTGSADGTACLWDLQGNKLITYQGHKSEILALAFSPDGKSIFTGSLDNTARWWDISGESIIEFRGHESAIGSIDYSPENKLIITGSDDGTARLWNTEGKQLKVFQGHSGDVHGTAFLPDGNSIISSAGRNVYIWDLEGNLIRKFGSPNGRYIYSFELLPDGKTIMLNEMGSESIYTFDIYGNMMENVIRYTENAYGATIIAASPDGNQILCSHVKDLYLFDKHGNRIKRFSDNSSDRNTKLGYIWGLDYNPNGSNVIAGHSDGYVSLFNLKTPLGNFQESGNYESLSLYQKLQFELIEYEDILLLETEEDLVEAATYYLDRAISSNSIIEIKDCLIKSNEIYDKLQESHYRESNLINQASVLTRLIQYDENQDNNAEKLDNIFTLILGSSNINILKEAAKFYHELLMESFSNTQKVEFANMANIFYEKLLVIDYTNENLSSLVENLIHLQIIEPTDSIEHKLDRVFNEMVSRLNLSDLREKERYYHNKAERSIDHRIADEYYSLAVVLIEKLLENNSDRKIRDHASSTYNNLAHEQLFTGKISKAVENAKRGIELKEENIIYTKLALAYLLNDQYRDAISIIDAYKDRSVGIENFKDYILNKIIELESAGINHPNFEKVREYLEE